MNITVITYFIMQQHCSRVYSALLLLIEDIAMYVQT